MILRVNDLIRQKSVLFYTVLVKADGAASNTESPLRLNAQIFADFEKTNSSHRYTLMGNKIHRCSLFLYKHACRYNECVHAGVCVQ